MIKCSKCGKPHIVNKTHNLCDECNYKRLHNGKTRREVYYTEKLPNIKKRQSVKRKAMLQLDREFYYLCFIIKPQICEECGKLLPNLFEDENGKLIAIWRYSHILTKAAFPEFRHNPDNINILCLEHHQCWEFGDRQGMKIYKSNQKRIEKIKDEYNH